MIRQYPYDYSNEIIAIKSSFLHDDMMHSYSNMTVPFLSMHAACIIVIHHQYYTTCFTYDDHNE